MVSFAFEVFSLITLLPSLHAADSPFRLNCPFAFLCLGLRAQTAALSQVGQSRAAVSMMAARKPAKKKVAKKSSGKSSTEGRGGILPWVRNEPGSECRAPHNRSSTRRRSSLGRRSGIPFPVHAAARSC